MISSSNTQYLLPGLETLTGCYINREQQQTLLEIAETLPQVNGMLLESPLEKERNGIDISMIILREKPDFDQFEYAYHAYSEKYMGDARWKKIHQFFKYITDRNDFFGHILKDVWYEIDTSKIDCSDFIPIPSLGFTIPNYESKHSILKTIDTITSLLKDHSNTTHVHEIINSLPSESRVSHLGMMFSRVDSHMRLNIRRLDSESSWNWVRSYNLNTINSAIPPDQWSQLWEISERPVVTVDISKTVGSRVGVECVFSTAKELKSMLDYLVNMGLCDPVKAELALQWSGYDVPEANNQLLTLGADGNTNESILLRKINHIKVVFIEGRPVQAKIYFWTALSPISLDIILNDL